MIDADVKFIRLDAVGDGVDVSARRGDERVGGGYGELGIGEDPRRYRAPAVPWNEAVREGRAGSGIDRGYLQRAAKRGRGIREIALLQRQGGNGCLEDHTVTLA